MSSLFVTGREAITLLIEQELGFQDYSENDISYLRSQVAGYMSFCMEKMGISLAEAQEKVLALAEEDREFLTASDPYADFIWSRGEEVGDLEIDAAKFIDEDYEGQNNLAHRADQNYWEHMENIADRNTDGYAPEVWFRSEIKFKEIMEVLQGLRNKYYGKVKHARDILYLKRVKNRINELRFGKQTRNGIVTTIHGGNELVFRHWAICFNTINELMDIKKRITLPEIDGEETEIDALDKANFLGVDPVFINQEISSDGVTEE
jgi:hypothetical protein